MAQNSLITEKNTTMPSTIMKINQFMIGRRLKILNNMQIS